MHDDRFEWDDLKAQSNIRKHNISFTEATKVFSDPLVADDLDDTMHYDEDRFRAVGMVNGVLITVFYTVRGPRIRVISARPSTRTEEQAYVDG